MGVEEKTRILKEVMEKEVQPYVELDAGGVRVEGLQGDFEVQISYEGSCTSCPSSTGATLSSIQRILQARVHPSLVVVPTNGW